MSDDTPPPESPTSNSEWRAYFEWRQQRRRASLVNPDKPADPVTVTLTAKEARQLSYMVEGWLDELSPSAGGAASEGGRVPPPALIFFAPGHSSC
jgi:hypothetical protein